jgi:hypothetical protein
VCIYLSVCLSVYLCTYVISLSFVFYFATPSVRRPFDAEWWVGWMMNWNGIEKKRSWHNLSHYPDPCLEGLRDDTKIWGRDSNWAPSEYKNRALQQCRPSLLSINLCTSMSLCTFINLWVYSGKHFHFFLRTESIFVNVSFYLQTYNGVASILTSMHPTCTIVQYFNISERSMKRWGHRKCSIQIM